MRADLLADFVARLVDRNGVGGEAFDFGGGRHAGDTGGASAGLLDGLGDRRCVVFNVRASEVY